MHEKEKHSSNKNKTKEPMEGNEIQSSNSTNETQTDQSIVLDPQNGEFVDTQEEEVESQAASLSSEASFVDDDSNTGIIKLYFAEQSLVATGTEPGTGGQYRFGRSKVYNASTANRYTKQGDAEYIFDNTKSILAAKNEFTTVEQIYNSIPDSFTAPFTMNFPSFKMQPQYEKIEQAPLESEVFVFAKTVALDNSEITINIKEKEPLLLDGGGNLNVVLVEGEGNNEREGAEVTDLQATVKNGQAAVKIYLRPKDEERDQGNTPNLDDWKAKIKGELQEGTYTYSIRKPGGITIGPGEASSIAATIVRISEAEVQSGYYIKKKDVVEILENTSGRITSVPNIPTYTIKERQSGSYTYTFTNPSGTSIGDPSTDRSERQNYIAGIIKDNIQSGSRAGNPTADANPKLKNGVSVKVEDIAQSLQAAFYNRGDTISFPTYKIPKPLLWLKANGGGSQKEDLNQSGEDEESYFEIGGSACCFVEETPFFAAYDREFPSTRLSNEAKENLRRVFRSITEYYSNEGRCCMLEQIAYLLATAKKETNHTFAPVREAYWLSESSRNRYFERMYDPVLGKDANRRSMARANGNTQQGDGVRYHGRGYVQLTWKNNYQKMKDKFNVDFVNNPELALEHEHAMKILIYGCESGEFTGRKLSDYINENQIDYYNARRVVNGTDAAAEIQGFAYKIERCLNIDCNCNNERLETNEFGLVQLTKLGNPNIINYGLEDNYSYVKTDGSRSAVGQHGDDWIKPEKANAFSNAVSALVAEYPNQKIHLNDCSAYNPSHNLGHSASGAHSRGDGFDCKFLTSNGAGTNNIFNLTATDIAINGRFVQLLKNTGQFSVFYSDGGRIPGTRHAAGHRDHLHGE